MNGQRRILKDHSILVEDGQIREISSQIQEKAELELDCRNKVVTPGFINCHAHISYGHTVRGLMPDGMKREEYLSRLFDLKTCMRDDEERIVSLYAMGDMLTSGYTTLVEPGTPNYIRAITSAAKLSRMRVFCGIQVQDVENPLNLKVTDATEAVKKSQRVIRHIKSLKNDMIKPCLAIFSPNYCSDSLLQALKEISDSGGVLFTMHVSEDERAVVKFKTSRGCRPVQYLSKIGVLGNKVLLAHCVFLSNDEIELLAATGTNVAFCPSSSVRGAGVGRLSKLPEMLDRGVTVGLGTDSAASSYYQDPFRIMYLCSVVFKDGRQNRSIMPPETVIELSTIKAAQALGVDNNVGSIEVGKRADLVVLKAGGPEWAPGFYPVYNLVFSADKSSVDSVIVDGNLIVHNGRLKHIDMEELRHHVDKVGLELVKRSGYKINHLWD